MEVPCVSARIRARRKFFLVILNLFQDLNKMKNYYLYIMTNKTNTTFYIGVTNNIQRRVYEHKNELVQGFTSKYKLKKLVYHEVYNRIEEAIAREKQLKNWHREWKMNLIKSLNPDFKDLLDAETSSA